MPTFFSGNGAVATTGSKTIVTGTSLELGSITLSGTTKASTLTIKGSAKTPVDVGGITDNSPLAGISAASATITGMSRSTAPPRLFLDRYPMPPSPSPAAQPASSHSPPGQ